MTRWAVMAARPHPVNGPYEDLNLYGPFPSKTEANAWLEAQPLSWRMGRITRVYQIKKDWR